VSKPPCTHAKHRASLGKLDRWGSHVCCLQGHTIAVLTYMLHYAYVAPIRRTYMLHYAYVAPTCRTYMLHYDYVAPTCHTYMLHYDYAAPTCCTILHVAL